MASRILTRPTIIRGSIREFFGDAPTIAGCWSLDGHARDESKNGNHGTVTGAIPYIGKMNGLSYYLDGNDYITIANSASIQLAQSEAVTLIVWTEMKGLTATNQVIFDKGSGTSNSLRLLLFYNTYGTGAIAPFTFGVVKQDINGVYLSSNISPSIGLRRCIVSVFTGGSSGTNMFIYVDGRLSVSGSFNLSGCSDCVGNLLIGSTWNNVQNVLGTFDNFAMFKRVLSPAEISQYYQWAIATPRKYWFYSPTLIGVSPYYYQELLKRRAA